jgi:hypothetical protein
MEYCSGSIRLPPTPFMAVWTGVCGVVCSATLAFFTGTSAKGPISSSTIGLLDNWLDIGDRAMAAMWQ